MKLTKGKPLIKPKYSDVYKFDLSFMIGDADGYENEVLFIDPSNPHIERFVKFLDDCEKAYPHGRGGRDSYNKKVPDFEVFCADIGETEDEDLQKFFFDWPSEPYNDCQTSFNGYILTYFDNDGIEYGVTIKNE